MAEATGWSEQTIRRMPLAKLFVLYTAAACAMNQPPPGPGYLERDMLAAMKKPTHQ